jgi:kumamolisin
MDLRGSERVPVAGARSVGQPRSEGRLEVTLRLRRRTDGPPFPDLRSYGGPTLSREAFAASYGLHPDDLARVREFARSHGFEVRSEGVGSRLVRIGGTVATCEETFGVALERWAFSGGTYRGRTGAVRLPAELDGLVVGVFGLDDRPQARTQFRVRTSPQSTDRSYTPLEVARAYNFPSGFDGTGTTLAFLELGGGYSEPQLEAYFRALGVAPSPVVAVSVDGATNAPSGDPAGPDGEVQLDLEIAGAVAPGAARVVYFAPNTDAGFLDGLSAAIHDTTRRPSVVSISWGSSEDSWTGQARSALNAACEDAAALGVTIVVAAGDGGASDGGPAGTLAVDFPASSPYALACGGTRLTWDGTAIVEEVVWNDLSVGEGATGGGVSQDFPRPPYQGPAAVPPRPDGATGRGVPDVAGDADPATGYQVAVDGTGATYGGTSAVAPLWAGLLARLQQALGRPVGFLNPLLYTAPALGTCRDITAGTNGGYSAGPGWDACTGWGSPDGAKLLAALRAAGAAAAP